MPSVSRAEIKQQRNVETWWNNLEIYVTVKVVKLYLCRCPGKLYTPSWPEEWDLLCYALWYWKKDKHKFQAFQLHKEKTQHNNFNALKGHMKTLTWKRANLPTHECLFFKRTFRNSYSYLLFCHIVSSSRHDGQFYFLFMQKHTETLDKHKLVTTTQKGP